MAKYRLVKSKERKPKITKIKKGSAEVPSKSDFGFEDMATEALKEGMEKSRAQREMKLQKMMRY